MTLNSHIDIEFNFNFNKFYENFSFIEKFPHLFENFLRKIPLSIAFTNNASHNVLL